MHLHSRAGALRQRLGKFFPDLALFHEEVFERDRAFGRANPLEHGRENLVSILQDRDLVAFEQRRTEELPHRADEGVIADGVIRPDGTFDLFLRLKKIPNDHDRQGAAQRGDAQEFFP